MRISSSIQVNQSPFAVINLPGLDLSPDPIFAQVEGRFTFVNPAAVSLFRAHSAGELLGTSLLERVHPQDQKWFSARPNPVEPRRNVTLSRLDGSSVKVEVSGVPLEIQGQPGTVVFGRAFSEISGTDLALQEIEATARRKHTEEKFHDLAGFVDDNPNPVARISRHGILLFANRAAAPLLDCLGVQVGQTLPADWRHCLDPLLEQGQSTELEFQRGGRTYSFQLVPIQDGDYIHFYGRDTTARTKAERALQESEARFRAIYEHAPIGVALVDCQTGKPVKTNPLLQEMLGFSEAELAQMSFAEFTHPEDLLSEWPLYQELIEGKRDSYQLEKRYIRKDGQMIWVRLNASLIKVQGNQSYAIGMVENITERRLAEAQLRYQAELLSTVKDAIIATDGHYRITSWNPAAEAIYGWTALEALGRPLPEVLPTEFIDPTWEEVSGAIGAGRDFQSEVRQQRKDGSWLPIESRAKALRDTKDGVTGYVRVNRDITNRKRAEEQLHEQVEENLKRAQELEAIVEVSAAMRKAQTRPEMMTLLLEELLSTLGAQAGALGLLNGNSLVFQAAAGQAAGWKGKFLPQGQNLFWDVLREGSPRVVDAPTNPTPSGFLAPFHQLSPAIQAGMILPLKNGAATMGVVVVGYNASIHISNRHKRLAVAIADMAGSALHRMSIAETLEKLVADRTRELETIYKVTAVASRPLGLGAALHSALVPILNAVDAQMGAILLVDDRHRRMHILADYGLPAAIKRQIENLDPENSLESWVITHAQPLLIPDLTVDPRVDKTGQPEGPLPFAALPMRVGKRMVGILEIARIGGSQFNLEDLTLLSFIADHLGLVIENAHLLAQAEQNAVHEERSRLARELHDSITQSLYSATLFAEGGRQLAQQGDLKNVQDCLSQLGQVSQQALKEMRLMVFELRSPGLRSEGLVRAIQHRLDAVENRAGIGASLEFGPLLELPERVEEALYRITLEALNNSLKHSHARNVLVSLEHKEDTICLCITDDGEGFDLAVAVENGGLGLTSMRERAERLKGNLHIFSTPGSGTEVIAEFPLLETRHALPAQESGE